MKGLFGGLFYFRPVLKNVPYHLFDSCRAVSTDSRKIEPGSIFFALKGGNFNGNDFVLRSLEDGAAYAVADEDRPEFRTTERIILVEDALTALQDLASEHRAKLKIPVIGLTGSNGKTTSKELLHAALKGTYSAYATKGNLNNHIGVPLSILEIEPTHEIAIIEMGANHQKEIRFLCGIARPDIGFITNIGLAHLEGFGGEEGVYIGKKELFDFLILTNGKLFVNVDDEKVVRAAEKSHFVSYGANENAHYQGGVGSENGLLAVEWWRRGDQVKQCIQTQLSGNYNFSNVMSAVAIASYFGVPDDAIKTGIEAYQPDNNRSQVEHTSKGNTVIVDCYNANPSSMKAALENLAISSAAIRMAILGDMLELGEATQSKHQEVIEQLRSAGIKAILVGDYFGATEHAGFNHFSDPIALSQELKLNGVSGTTILLKGSRKMKLEQLLELL